MDLEDQWKGGAATSSTMAEDIPSWLPAGMDAKSSYLLKIKITSTTMRKDVSAFCFDKILDSDTINHGDFIGDFGKKYPWAHNQMLKMYYVDDCTYHQVNGDQDMVQMFAKFASTKQIDILMHIHGVNENPQLPPILPKTSVEVPCTPLAVPSQAALCQPGSSTQPSLHNHVPEENDLTSPFEKNEHVGVDDEGMYLDDNGDTEGGAANGKEADIEPDYVPDSSDSDEEGVKSEDEDWVANDAVLDNIPTIAYDEDNPPMTVGTLYPNMDRFRMALAQYAIVGEFEYNIEKSEPGRYRANCADENCDWRIYAKVMDDDVTIKVKINTMNHTCGSTKLNDDIKPASSKWVAEKIRAWLLEDAIVRPKELRRRLHDKYGILVSYKKVYYGKEIAISQLYGSWDESFDKLYNYKAQIEKSNPGSIFVIDHHETAGAIRFNRLFFALKPCIDGFLQGCRPYLAIDSTFLTGKFKGQLATACAIDGHNWMYPVAFGVIDSETSLNWVWFMERLKDAIGTPEGLTICNDAGKGIDGAVHEVFPTAEHRECMMHLVTNFKKRYHGKVFDDHLWPAAYSWNPYHYNKHMGAIQQAKPEAIEYLRKNHIRLWSRSQFSTCSKVDYVTNNLAESFNNWVKKYKALNLADFFDKVGHKLMVKWELRRRISRKMQGHILPHIVKELNEKSRGLNLTVDRSDEHIAQVTCLGTSGFRHVVNLKEKTCTCCEWQLSGKPCVHTIALNCKMRGSMEQLVHEYFTVDKFRAAYALVIHPLPDSSQWPKSEHGFMLHPPILKPVAGRRRTERYKGCSEKNKKGSHQCPICKQYGHRWHTCRNGDPDQMAAMLLERGPPKKRKKKKIESETTIVPAPTMMYPPSINWNSTSSTRSVTGSKAKGGKSRVKSAASGQHTPSATKGKSSNVAHSSPAMNTRSKVATASSPAMGTRSKVPTASSPNVGSKRKLY